MDLRKDLIPEKVNEGRLISALSLEQRVLANGVLPNSQLMERVSLVKGIITGLLEQGHWNDAVRMVYQDGSPARALFDGDWEGLRKEILASVQKPSRQRYIGDNVAGLLIKHGETELLYDIACQLPMEAKDLEKIMDMVSSKIPPERLREGHNTVAARAEKDHDFERAYKHYQQAQNTKAIDTLYQKLLKKLPDLPPDRYGPLAGCFGLLADIAEDTNTKENSRVAEVVYTTLENLDLLRSSREIPRRLMAMVEGHELALSKSQDDMLKDAFISQSDMYLLEKMESKDLSLRWAKFHAQSSPKNAYGIFKRQEYAGPEMVTAIQQGLKNRKEKRDHYQGLEPEEIGEPHLRQAYDQLSLELKVSVAIHLKDNELLQGLSTQYSRQEEKGSIETAYRLWIYGQGNLNGPYVEKLRTLMMEKELKDERPSASLFLLEDTIGNKLWYARMMDRNPKVAYDIAKQIQKKGPIVNHIQNEPLVHQARLKMIAASPLEALQKFEGYREEEKDSVGINMALDALAQQYNVSRQKIDEYLALQK